MSNPGNVRVRPYRRFKSREERDDIKVERILARDWTGYISIAEKQAVVRHLTGRINHRTGKRYSAAYIAELLGLSARSVVRMRTALGIKDNFWHTRPTHRAYLRRLRSRFDQRCAAYAPRPGDTGPPGEREQRYADAVCSRSDIRIAMALEAGHSTADIDRCGYHTTQFAVEPIRGRVPFRDRQAAAALRRSA